MRSRFPSLESDIILLTNDKNDNPQEMYFPYPNTNDPLLPNSIASVVSSVSMASRLTLRFCNIVADTAFESLKFSTAAGLGLGRRAIVTALSSARSLHQFAIRQTDVSSDSLSFYKVLDRYTNFGVSLVYSSFSLAELLTLTTFHLASSTLKFSLESAEECVRIFDGVFGETDTSKALAAMIQLFYQEWKGQDDALGLSKSFGKLFALGQITKAMTAYCCLQYLNRQRLHSMTLLHPIFEGTVKKNKGTYDPEVIIDPNQVFTFKLSTNEKSKTWEHTRRKSMEPLAIPKNLAIAPPGRSWNKLPRRRCASGPDNDFIILLDSQKSKIKAIEQPIYPLASSRPSDMKALGFHNVKLGSRFVKFAMAAYGIQFLRIMGVWNKRDMVVEDLDEHHNHVSFAAHTGIPVDHIITSSYRNPDTLQDPTLIAPVHYVAIDHSTKSIVVCLRGTLGLSDVITDIKSYYIHYKFDETTEGYTHAGMFHCAQVISNGSIKDCVIEALNSHTGYSLVLTGHSLGGGCASILALLWSKKIQLRDGTYKYVTNQELGFPVTPIHCFVYGCPAVLSAELSKDAKGLVTTFVFRNDIVCRLSLGLVRDFRNVTINMCTEKGIAETVISKALGIFKDSMMGKEHDLKDELWYWALLKTLRADMKAEKLYPPGTIYWINSPYCNLRPSLGKTIVTLHEVDDVEIAFGEIAFSRTMFTDHSPHHYEGSLEILSTSIKV